MANQKHLKILNDSISAWNRWRVENPSVVPDLSGAVLAGRDLNMHHRPGVDFSKTDLRHADLKKSNLRLADLRHANLCQATLSGALLKGADLSRADLTEANLTEADLSWALLHSTNLACSIMGYTNLGNINLSKALGLDRVNHIGPSEISISTVFRSYADISATFLRSAGVPEDFIIYMRSLVGKSLEFYSCFISYSTEDQEFAARLHADLQGKGVSCWFAPEDLKTGDPFRQRIDEAIRQHDKLMVVLSESSVNSAWVEKEVETAFEEERQQSRTTLFPIRLDDAVMETVEAWAADIRRTRHIGDFRDWKNHDSYKKAFERLLRDLKSETKAGSATQTS